MRPELKQLVTFLYTGDLGKSSDFYTNILQLPLILDQGSCQIYQISPTGFLGLCEKAAATGNENVIVTLVSDQVDEWYAYLLEKGVEIEKPPTLNETFNIYHLFLRDPNGYLLEIQEFLDADWPK